MQDAPILFEELSGQEGEIGLITLNRPKALNALNHEMVIRLHEKLLLWEAASQIKAVVICAAEGRAFCAGGDLRTVYEKHLVQDETLVNFFIDEYRLNHRIYHYKKPYLAFLDGITMGGGAGISLHGSHRIGTERLSFAMPETSIGFFPDVGGSYFLSRLPECLGTYLALTSARLSCDDCRELGLIDYKLAPAALPLVLKALLDTPFKDQGQETVSQILETFQLPLEPSTLMKDCSRIHEHFKKSSLEEILISLEADKNAWCQETVSMLRQKSPTSLKVTHQQLKEGLKRDFDECLELEYQLMTHFTQGHDFYEGIRALLIDKDQAPEWQPAELNAVSQSFLESFFKPLAGQSAQLLFS